MPRESIRSLGRALTATIWLLAGLMMLAAIAGGCEANCSAGGEGARTLLWIASGAAALNLLTAGLIAGLKRRG